ncbi:MAG: 50S ribosomal protein L17 [Chloroflexota bacterium]|nr:50S ribosomal protein L17 [Chloroflexota bacterium]
MRHRMAGSRRFGRNPAERAAMLKNLAVSLIEHERVRTTQAKASEVRPMIEKLISLSREDSAHHRQLAEARLSNRPAVAKLFDDIGPRMSNRNGGYTRIYKLGNRRGDGAEIVQLEILD